MIEKTNNLSKSSRNLAKYHEGKEKQKDSPHIKSDHDSSLCSISSADERDMQILFDGDHVYQFQALQMA
jgi:hypothetical protein